MNVRLSSAPSEASPEAAPSPDPTGGEVSAEAEREGQTREIDQQIAAVDERVRGGTSDPDVDEDDAPASTGSEEEPAFVESLGAHYATAKANGSNWFSAGLSTLAFAFTSGGGKFWEWAKDFFSGKKKEEGVSDLDEDEDTDSDFALDTDTAASAQPQGFVENMKSLLAEFGLTETADERKNFFLVAVELGKEVQSKYNIPYQVVVAQACLESGFGTSGLTKDALNCFGYKKGSADVPYITMKTHEYNKHGVLVEEDADFRSYSSLRDSFMAYGRLISGAPRYQEAFKYKNDPKRFLQELIKGGYAGGNRAKDPKLVQKYIASAEGAIDSYGLTLD